jgi:hypothetical protein
VGAERTIPEHAFAVVVEFSGKEPGALRAVEIATTIIDYTDVVQET